MPGQHGLRSGPDALASARHLRGRKSHLAIAALVACLVATCTGVSLPALRGHRLLWQDNFSGSAGSAPNPANWTYDVGGSGWGNDELECYTDNRTNSYLDGKGHLVIAARYDPGFLCAGGVRDDYTSARLTTKGLRTLRYGTIVMRAELPTGPGSWPAFWALGQDIGTAGWPASGEIDAAEVIGSEPRTVNGSIHARGWNGQPYVRTSHVQSTTTLSGRFHTYGVTWTPTRITFTFDGHAYYSVTKADATASGNWPFQRPFYLLLDVAVGGTWPGPPTSATRWPQRMVIDYVRAYSR